MPLDQRHHVQCKQFEALFAANHPFDQEAAIASFEDRLWTVADRIFSERAPALPDLSETASLAARTTERYASILAGAEHLVSLNRDADIEGLSADLAATEGRLLSGFENALLTLRH